MEKGFNKPRFCPNNGKTLKNSFILSQKIYFDLYLTVGRVNKYYLYWLYKNMYIIQWKIDIFNIVLIFACQKQEPELTQNIGSGSRSNFKSPPTPAKKNRLRLAPAPQHCSIPVFPVLFCNQYHNISICSWFSSAIVKIVTVPYLFLPS